MTTLDKDSMFNRTGLENINRKNANLIKIRRNDGILEIFLFVSLSLVYDISTQQDEEQKEQRRKIEMKKATGR